MPTARRDQIDLDTTGFYHCGQRRLHGQGMALQLYASSG